MLKKINNWWESICNGCGECCYEKEFNEYDIVFINFEKPCKFLNECDQSCSVYNDRFKINPLCRKVNIYEALFNPFLPPTCGYVKKFRFWEKKSGR